MQSYDASDYEKRPSVKKDQQILHAANRSREILIASKFDPDRWAESEGFFLEHVNSLRADSDAEILGEVIFVRKDLEPLYKLLCIGHEIGHNVLHAKCIGYRITDKVLVKKTEREAETFASLVLFPSLVGYELEQDFIGQSGLPPKTAKLRINFFRRTGI